MQSDLTNGAGRFPRANLVQLPKDGVGQPEGAIPVLVPANSCMIFDRRLWHAQSPNYSQAERLVLFMGYGARWLKARDAMYVEDAMAMTTCPLRRQMLGYTTQNSGLYHVRAVYFFALSCAGSLANPKGIAVAGQRPRRAAPRLAPQPRLQRGPGLPARSECSNARPANRPLPRL